MNDEDIPTLKPEHMNISAECLIFLKIFYESCCNSTSGSSLYRPGCSLAIVQSDMARGNLQWGVGSYFPLFQPDHVVFCIKTNCHYLVLSRKI